MAVKPNVQYLLEAESSIIFDEDSDWVFVGINHPAGKYLELIAELENLALDNGEKNGIALKLIRELDIFSMVESSVSKALIACYFARFNTWANSDRQYVQPLRQLS